MIKINDTNGLSRLLFLSDLYEMVLGIRGGIIHVGAWEGDAELWDSLKQVYEPKSARRRLVCKGCEDVLNHLAEHGSVTALVYFDDTAGHSVETIREILEMIVPYLVRGSVLAFSRFDVGEQVSAVMEVIGLNNLAMQRWHHSRRDCYAIV